MNPIERRVFLKDLTAATVALTIYPKDFLEAIIQEEDTFPWTRVILT